MEISFESYKLCNWYLHGRTLKDNLYFILNQNILYKVTNLIHLGLPIGDQQYVDDFFNNKFNKVEKSLSYNI
jgi:hypothetical protein